MGELTGILRSRRFWGAVMAGLAQLVPVAVSGQLGENAKRIGTAVGAILYAVGAIGATQHVANHVDTRPVTSCPRCGRPITDVRAVRAIRTPDGGLLPVCGPCAKLAGVL